MSMISLSEDQVRDLVQPGDAFEAVTKAHLALQRGQATDVVRSRARSSTMSLHSMSAASEPLDRAAAKVYSATRGKVRSHVLLYQLSTGELLSIMEANNLGRLRTCAVPVVAANLLVEPEPTTLGIVGAGFQAEGLIRSFCDASSSIPIESIIVFRRDQAKLAEFVEKASSLCSVSVVAAKSPEEVASNAGILVTATTSSKPVVEADWLSKVKHVSSIGSNSLSRREVSPRVVTAAHSVIVDSIEGAKKEAGDLLSPIENGKLLWSQVGELGELLADQEKAREVRQLSGFSLFCSQGLAVQDLFLASLVYERSIQ